MAKRPNIVFLLADDLGYGDFGAFNNGLSHTPALDALMTESVCLTQHYTASPVCNPSRACLLTGRYPHRTGSIDTLEWRGLERLSLRETTLAQMLQRNGYTTGLVGKWHLGAFDPAYHPMNRGFDETICFRGGMHDYWQWRLERGKSVLRADGRYLTDVWAEEAVQFIERRRMDEPFFLHVTFNAPHTPLQAPEEEIEPFLGVPGINRGVATLYGMIHRMDTAVARILETLDRRGLRDNTIVFFTSDNGPQFGGAGEECLDRFNCHWAGAKGVVYEGGIRVPLFVRWPDGLPAGVSTDRMVHFSDWLPTILSMTGTPLPEQNLPLDGINVLPVLQGEDGQVQTRRFWQWNRYTPEITSNAAVRDGDWKLVRPCIAESMYIPPYEIPWHHDAMYNHDKYLIDGIIREPQPERHMPAAPAPELYNLATDPLEQHNLADSEPEQVGRLLRLLETWFDEVDAERRSLTDVWPNCCSAG